MNITHIVCTYPPYYGGMGNVVFQTAKALLDRGHNVTVLTPGYHERKEIKGAEEKVEEEHAPELEKQEADVKRIAPAFQYGNAAYLPTIAEELDAADIVHLHYPFYGTANLVRKWKKKHPEKGLVITYHMDPRSQGWRGLVFSLYAKFVMPKVLAAADAICVSSFDYAESSEAALLYAKQKDMWHELPFGVDTDRFAPRKKDDLLLKKHTLDPNISTILFVGGMDEAHHFKGIPVLLKSLVLLKKSLGELQVVLLGEGELKEQFELQARALGVEGMVRFVGRVSEDDLPLYYNLADLFVLPSIHRGEAFGMVLLEAFASGVPVIASDLAGVRTVAERAGVVVQPKNVYALAQAIQDYIELKDKKPLKEQARQAAETVYNWESIGEQLECIYTNML
ncbi:glycosyltransferase family 4 protein [Patescibacteria group bacterium]|nr:glycosyltransferase family 4 protein [Patescibacteria group bacterium]MBU1722032.1 glycosyltransferase family 4 protein [Patescibacteria group bacterium]MBU1901765.1 glycosyltransferase family 4 protein [Patescibacteria group bacterium]